SRGSGWTRAGPTCPRDSRASRSVSRSWGGLQEDPQGRVDGTAVLGEVDREVQVDIGPSGQLERRRGLVPGSLELPKPPAHNALGLGFPFVDEVGSRHTPSIALAPRSQCPQRGELHLLLNAGAGWWLRDSRKPETRIDRGLRLVNGFPRAIRRSAGPPPSCGRPPGDRD